MTSSENTSASNRSVYDTCDPDYLRQLRQASGVEDAWLARTACLSLGQVRQLEEGGESLFYSPIIKRQAYKRLLMILGAEPPSLIMDAVASLEPAAVDELNEIIAMEKNLNGSTMADVLQTLRDRLVQHWALALVVLALGVTTTASLVKTMSEPEDAALAERAPTKTSESLPLAAALPEKVSSAVAGLPLAVAAAPTVAASLPVAASTSATATATATSTASVACQYTRDVLPQISPLTATKPSRYVYMVAAADVSVCVVDGNQQASLVQLKAGESRSVYGSAPWQVSSSKLASVQIYFQGWRVALPEGRDQRVVLIEKSN